MITPLKRLFLNSTSLPSEGAIALAEFLPESHHLLHLDLTDNLIDISGVLALAVSLKMNHALRCLDLNIPFDDPDFSRLSQDILNTCVRNTEMAQREAEAKAAAVAAAGPSSTIDAAAAPAPPPKRIVIAQPIRKSALASNLEAQQRHLESERQRRLRASERTSQGDIFAAAEETKEVVAELLGVDQAAAARGVLVRPSGLVRDALVQLQLAEAQLAEAAGGRSSVEEEGAFLSLSLPFFPSLSSRTKKMLTRSVI